jgi:uroporphyrinogen decarboxylase
MASCTPRERVWQAIRHVQPDRVPHHISYTQVARVKLEAYYGTSDLDAVLDNHIVKYKPRPPEVQEAPGMWRDEFGVLWNRMLDTDIGIVAAYRLKERSLKGFAAPDPHDARRYAGLPGFIAHHPDRFRIINLGKSLFERAWMLRGLPEIMIDMLEAPAFVEELLDAITVFNLEIIAEVTRYDIDAVMFGDDWGQQNGLLFSPRLWRQLIRPCVERMYRAVHTAGKAVFIHSCGKVQSLFPELIEAGVDVFNPFQPEVMDPYETKRQWGHVLTFYGGLSIQRLLPYGTPQQVRDEARRLMGEVGRGGGFIIAPSHDMPGDIPIENLVAFVETVKQA